MNLGFVIAENKNNNHVFIHIGKIKNPFLDSIDTMKYIIDDIKNNKKIKDILIDNFVNSSDINLCSYDTSSGRIRNGLEFINNVNISEIVRNFISDYINILKFDIEILTINVPLNKRKRLEFNAHILIEPMSIVKYFLKIMDVIIKSNINKGTDDKKQSIDRGTIFGGHSILDARKYDGTPKVEYVDVTGNPEIIRNYEKQHVNMGYRVSLLPNKITPNKTCTNIKQFSKRQEYNTFVSPEYINKIKPITYHISELESSLYKVVAHKPKSPVKPLPKTTKKKEQELINPYGSVGSVFGVEPENPQKRRKKDENYIPPKETCPLCGHKIKKGKCTNKECVSNKI